MAVNITLENEHYDSVCVPKMISKTIEERAERYGMESANLLCSNWSEEQRQKQAKIYAKVYANIATEQKAIDDANTIRLIQEQKELSLALIERQKAIDIDKAKEWVNEFCTETNYAKDEIPIIVKSIELFMEE